MATISFTFFTAILLFSLCNESFALNSIRPSESINSSDGTTLVSNGESFELGFFTPGNSTNRYVGIWYKNIPVQTVVWVANRCSPINDSSGLLMINDTGNLVLLNHNKSVVWSTNSSKEAKKPIVELLDSGNLVLRDEEDGNSENYLWQSFDYPCDNNMPEMKIGQDLRTGFERRLSAWKSWDNPCPGDFTYGIELNAKIHSFPEPMIRRGKVKFYRTGPWIGLRFSGSPDLRPNPVFDYEFVSNDEEVYYTYHLKNKSVISRIVMNQTTLSRQRLTWMEAEQSWKTYNSVPRDYCDNYGLCGANGKCIINENPVCQCLDGFTPKYQEKWSLMDWSGGCVRNVPLSCEDKASDGFVKYSSLKLPDAEHSWVNASMNLKECRAICLSNCTCMAYSNSDIRGDGSGCAMWFSDLLDIRQFSSSGQDLYIRMPASELEKAKSNRTVKRAVIAVAVVIGVVCGMVLVGCYICRRRKITEETERNLMASRNEGQEDDLELPLFSLPTIINATNCFSFNNKLGEGGFGPVYKGMLEGRQEIAVKRLSMCSGQGVNEFMNEVKLIAKLQHRNLVKLFGCCIQGEEKLLVYEYMPNRSLDFFIFDVKQGKILEWSTRFQIICGIARGLLYLHHDSRLRIIHRDLKASNVLLDKEMNPKISDFGLARMFGGDQIEGNTSRVVGTYGYMAPEYAFDGLFSIKSDVFSFGILVLEIISGKRSRGFHYENHGVTLIGHAWTFLKEGRALELIDARLVESDENLPEVLRCIHVGLLCVQQRPVDRPNMSTVVLMLGGESSLPQPKPPGYFMETDCKLEGDHSSSKPQSSSTCDISISVLEPR
ncbi:G-type lectin S-receptor-like serine/threonine-protein kinase At4g27290 isoform X1 [Morus notabilis]|uniref:G-type lectin S-receptor-like serine/threonine-protein kinase At4g27290 isoform X1 n=1 Tax=Morus notabilis TaxID=981085 RepID=UPI000CED74E3|nr:G-type lectin S-receptor-like serine/threonine-protein kinase At4g27290 isoform X1 [Morus notabilis]